MRRRVGHALVILAGLLIVAYPFTLGARADVQCYGRPLQPGQSCAKADGSAGQTYEQRVQNAHAARPIIVTTGVLVMAFGAGLMVVELRRSRTAS